MIDNGYKGWLRYDRVNNAALAESYRQWTKHIVIAGEYGDGPLASAANELKMALDSMLGMQAEVQWTGTEDRHAGKAIVVGTLGSSAIIDSALTDVTAVSSVSAESYWLRTVNQGGRTYVLAAGVSASGALYAVFHLLRLIQSGESLESLQISESPKYSLRMINHWDNMDGSIERGYAGDSIFFRNNELLSGSGRIRDYARMMASIGINGIAINNVNVHRPETFLITERLLPQVAEIASVFREYGIKLYLSVNYAATIELGDLDTADPLDERVRAWWKEKAAEVYRHIPDFGGFLVKADSENRPGPFTYGRNHADGANMLGEALQPYGGLVLWRCFVYNCHQDWRDRSTDRARAAYDHFKPLDGQFMDNVVLQIKNGPMDFQVREPVSPLFGAMQKTNQMMEFQITQEYTGQQRHVCFLVPQWKEVLDFDTHHGGNGSTIKEIAAGNIHPYMHSGITAVSNIGDDDNWTGHHLAQANLYGYGRLIWNPDLTSEQIASEWTSLTFGADETVGEAVVSFLLESWSIYESYTSPLGVGWMVRPHYHYGPDIDGYEYSKWGTYHFADHLGIGVNRTKADGTGYAGQYESANAAVYESLESCPDELLLFFHHVPYTHVLHSGSTVIQHIYDTHFSGVERVAYWQDRWAKLEGRVDELRFRLVAGRLNEQLENAKEWRDIVNTYFYRKSGIEDARGRTIY
ncbi:alpha-glucuronidase family glycosyl hydrolase [Paenibacillus sp. NEAU-GSW1]|uniref:alpha-glucuronidase family glycosyl hydrolase n=1 Tax=Paenibacillus sp. NEAU-GSW1 TaxID=2682486 RepID=UPI0012E11005|nr:alpha-glucuronidase family glycosyl hydrolase [Paenibacillus sp. NEAU-GSW1]MUT67494.1 alpha-glucuronidase [Paenibacillus sp. NEAU-GSW1]